jgi:spermidine/putrescine-binding protein
MTYRTDVVQPTNPVSWEELWKVPHGKVESDNAPVQLLAIAGRLNGIPWDSVLSMNGRDLQAAVNRLRELRPIGLPSSTTEKINAFRTKDAYIGQTFSLSFADILNKQVGAPLAKSVIPAEGTFGALDGPMLLKGAPNRANAMKYIDFEAGRESQEIYWSQYQSPTANRVATEAIIRKGGTDERLMKAQAGSRPEVAAALIQQQDPADPAAWTRAWDQVIA